jgi:hypothetical protein
MIVAPFGDVHGDLPVLAGQLSLNRRPNLATTMPKKNPNTASTYARLPSPTRYRMPLPQPPAKTIPMPKMYPPMMFAQGTNA